MTVNVLCGAILILLPAIDLDVVYGHIADCANEGDGHIEYENNDTRYSQVNETKYF